MDDGKIPAAQRLQPRRWLSGTLHTFSQLLTSPPPQFKLHFIVSG
jgi:hypothetical protein